MMERITRQFVLFEGLAIGILSIIYSVEALYDYFFNYSKYEAWNYYNVIDSIHEIVIPIELCWMLAAGAMLYGIFRRDVRWFYPIIGVAIMVLLIQFVREILLFWFEHEELFWDFTLFFNPVIMLCMTCRRILGMMTLLALKRLFESEQSANNNFVRFDARSENCEAV
ncbi:uncharacterized protein LOC134214486 [Armigeres subalbatus]|uniref:uncharacterized protein LOC134214486 n=1 Tax=Armigeres subalbatus TaxID=124917 RepID=UPI002ED555DB